MADTAGSPVFKSTSRLNILCVLIDLILCVSFHRYILLTHYTYVFYMVFHKRQLFPQTSF